MSHYEHDQLATPDDACREFARNVGSEHPERPWILTDFDTWQKNPFYHGPAVPYPEDYPGEPGDEPVVTLPAPTPAARPLTDDDIPF